LVVRRRGAEEKTGNTKQKHRWGASGRKRSDFGGGWGGRGNQKDVQKWKTSGNEKQGKGGRRAGESIIWVTE